MDLAELDLRELRELRKSVDKTLVSRLKEEKRAVIAEVEQLVKSRGFTIAELFSSDQAVVSRSAKPTKPSRVAYRDPHDPSKTWGGRGRRPDWLAEALDAGRSADEFLVKQKAATTELVSTDKTTTDRAPADGATTGATKAGAKSGAAKAPKAAQAASAGTKSSTAGPKPAAKRPSAKKAVAKKDAVKQPAARKPRKPAAEKSDS